MEVPENDIIHGDAFDVLADLDENSVHAVVTDPPYNFDGGFMGVGWDDIGSPKDYQDWCEEWSRLAYQVLKPGGHLLAFSSSQMHHRLFCGVSDAGFTIRDTLVWIYGGGFPKSQDVSKKIDEKLGVADEREIVDERVETSGWKAQDKKNAEHGYRPNQYYDGEPDVITTEAPASDLAARFDGFGTQLKPAAEYIVLARKPLEKNTIAENVIEHGTGALNIESSRITVDGDRPKRETTKNGNSNSRDYQKDIQQISGVAEGTTEEDRFPANVLLDQRAASMLDQQSGDNTPEQSTEAHRGYIDDLLSTDEENSHADHYSNTGGASRFFYTSKATPSEKTMDGKIENDHVAVKPIDLMEHLVKLVTARGQLVLDPFAGTGTTLLACKQNHRKFIGIEADSEWVNVSKARVGLEPDDPEVLTEDDQMSLTQFGGE